MKSNKTLTYQQHFLQLLLQPVVSKNKGMAAYQYNRWAQAERALSISFPTVAQLMGKNFFGLSRAFLLEHPHTEADWGSWGEAFPQFIFNNQHHIGLPYLSDVAQLDWLVHTAERQDKDTSSIDTIHILEKYPADQIGIKLNSTIYFLSSRYPLLEIWKFHQPNEDTTHWSTKVREALQDDNNLFHFVISQQKWQAKPLDISLPEYQFMQGLLGNRSLASLLDELAATDFDFTAWLTKAISEGWINKFYVLPFNRSKHV